MQTTLLSLAFAVILALLAALFGPHVIDWSQYRDQVELRASQVLGTPVRVHGRVDLRLLPIPWISAESVEIGGEAKLRARSLRVEFAFGPMLRGEWRATDVRLGAPEIALGLDRAGRLGGVPGLPGLDPDNFLIERLVIEDGRVTFADAATGWRQKFENIAFAGDLRSLFGPLRGEGRLVVEGAPVNFRIGLGRVADEGARLRLTVEPADAPLTIETEGTLRLAEGSPRFEGGLTVARSARTRPEGASAAVARLTSKIRASAAGAAFEQIELQIGAEERPTRITGSAELKTGRPARLEAHISARQFDADAFVARADSRRPLDVLAALAETLKDAPRLPFTAQVGFGVDVVTLAGSQLTNVRGEAKAQNGGWELQRLDLRAPGLSQVKISGRLATTASGPTFLGPATVEAGDAKALFAWIEGRTDAQSLTKASHMRASGALTLGRERLAVDALKIEIDRKPLEGRLALERASDGAPKRLDVTLKAGDLDADALLGSIRYVFAGSTASLPDAVHLDLDFARATLLGVSAAGVAAQARFDSGGLAVERLAVADLGGAAFAARGRIEEPFGAPQGSLAIDLDARDLGGLTTFLSAFSPLAAEQIQAAASRLTPAKLRLNLKLERTGGAGGAPSAALNLEGRAGVLRVGLVADANGTASLLRPSDWKFDARVDADDGGVLASLLGLDRVATLERRAASLRLVASGIAAGASRVEARLNAGGVEAGAKGSLVFGGAPALSGPGGPAAVPGAGSLDLSRLGVLGAIDFDVSVANASRLRHPRGVGPPLPVALKGRLSFDGPSVSIDDLSGTVAGSAVHGKFDAALEPAPRLTGRIEVADAAAPVLASAVLGLTPSERPDAWSSEPFAARFGDLSADVQFKLARAELAPALVARDLAGRLRLGPERIAIESVSGELEGGRLSGDLVLTRAREGSAARVRFALKDMRAQFGVTGGKPPRIAGLLSLAGEVEGAGLSPAALIGSLKGSGVASLDKGAVFGLNARVFDRAVQAVDQGLPLDANRVGDFVTTALDGGRLTFGRADVTLTVTDGQLRLSPFNLRLEGIEVGLTAQAGIADGQADARISLAGVRPADRPGTPVPEVSIALKGRIGEAKRTVDVTGLVAWLTLRAVERQARRIEAIENAEREADIAPTRPAPASPVSTPPIVTPSVTPSGGESGAIELAPPLPPAIEIPGGTRRGSPPPQRTLPRPPANVDGRGQRL